jgi:hypothetical protein
MTSTDPPSSAVKVMRLRRDGTCRCGTAVPAGDRAGWDSAARAVVCLACLDGAVSLELSSSAVIAETPPPSEPATRVEVVAATSGDPGASLLREYERRSAAREKRVREKHPRIGGFLLAVTSEPQSTTAFKTGAEGERRVAARLEKDAGEAALFLHNRRLGAGRRDGDVDHIAVAPGGVYVIDAKRYNDKKVEVRRSGGLFSPAREQLFIGGRDRTVLLDSVARQLAAVRAALDLAPGGSDVPVHAVLCFVDAVLPLFGTMRIGSVRLLGPKATARLIATDGPYDAATRAALHAHLADRLPPAR